MFHLEVMNTVSLFKDTKRIQEELNHRAWVYLNAIGFKPYESAPKHMRVELVERNKMNLIWIHAEFEMNFVREKVDIQVPEKQFEALTATVAEAT
jgi:hypothetical protein